MSLLTLLLLYAAGTVAGVMNTVGGGGSVLTLPALIFLGDMSSTSANATNRIGLIAQNSMAIWRFRRGGVREDHVAWRVTAAGLVGCMIGALFAAQVPAAAFDKVLGVIMLALLVLIVLKPKPKLRKRGGDSDAWSPLPRHRKHQALISFFLVGIYAGLIQAGAGIVILALMGYMFRMDLVRGNYVKLVFILVLNVLAFGIFWVSGLEIRWVEGVMVFLGQVTGAYMGSWVALKKGEGWIMWILIISILLSSGKLLGVDAWVMGA